MELQESFIIYRDESFRLFYLHHYLPLNAGVDNISRSLLKFKRGQQPHLDTWINTILGVAGQLPHSPGTIILRALHHDETIVRPDSPLDLLGHALATRLHCRFLPSLLQKSRPTPANKSLHRKERETELQNIYSIDPDILPNLATSLVPTPSFLLIDDILTTGSTVLAILHNLRQSFPLSPIHIFTIAKASYHPTQNPDSPLHTP